MFQIEGFWRQVSKKVCFWDLKFRIKSDSGIKFFQRVRFWIERFSTCRILNYNFSNSHGSGLSFLQRVRVLIHLLSRKKINLCNRLCIEWHRILVQFLPEKSDNFCSLFAFSKYTIRTKSFLLQAVFELKTPQPVRFQTTNFKPFSFYIKIFTTCRTSNWTLLETIRLWKVLWIVKSRFDSFYRVIWTNVSFC